MKGADGDLHDVVVEDDDGIRSGITMAALAKLPTVFKKDGSTTPGNASQVFRTPKGPVTSFFNQLLLLGLSIPYALLVKPYLVIAGLLW